MEEFKIEIESTGDYTRKKEFSLIVSMTPRDFIALQTAIMDFLEDMGNSADIIPAAIKDEKN